MGKAFVLNTASKANTTGGTFADSLVANAGDSLSVANFNTGAAKMVEMWAIDSDSVAELQVIYTRPESTHDQQHGLRFNVPALVPGGAAVVAAHNLLAGYGTVDLYKSDTPTMQVTTTAADDFIATWVTKYDDLPGVQGVFSNPAQVAALQKSIVGIACNAVASGTPGAYGTQRAFNADDDRLHANTWYAILGWTLQTVCTTISLLGPDWGGQRIGGAGGVLGLDDATGFWDQALKRNDALIPGFNSNKKGNVLVQFVHGESS